MTPPATLDPPVAALDAPASVWLAALPHAAWLVALPAAVVVAVNAAAVRLLGRPAAELVGLPAQELATSPEDLAWWQEAQAAGAQGSAAPWGQCVAGPVLDSETIFARADGGLQHVRRTQRR